MKEYFFIYTITYATMTPLKTHDELKTSSIAVFVELDGTETEYIPFIKYNRVVCEL